MPITSAGIQEKARIIEKVSEALEEKYGVPRIDQRADPLEVLISTILSQNTNDKNRDRAYEGLKSRFPHWKELLEADTEEVAEAIRMGGLAHQKADRIKEVLRWAYAKWGRLTLAPLCDMGTEEAREILLGLKGVGMKTANCVLAFGCGRDVFPIDTHILRVTKRLGLVPVRATAEKAHGLLTPFIPSGTAISLHLNLIRYGREICRARQPRFDLCLFPELCILHSSQKDEKRELVRR